MFLAGSAREAGVGAAAVPVETRRTATNCESCGVEVLLTPVPREVPRMPERGTRKRLTEPRERLQAQRSKQRRSPTNASAVKRERQNRVPTATADREEYGSTPNRGFRAPTPAPVQGTAGSRIPFPARTCGSRCRKRRLRCLVRAPRASEQTPTTLCPRPTRAPRCLWPCLTF